MKTLFFAMGALAVLAPLSYAQNTNPIFPVSFTAPKSWKVLKTQDNNTLLVPSNAVQVDALLVTHFGLYEKFEPLVTGLANSLKDLNCKNIEVSEEGEKVVQGKKAYVARGRAQNAQGMPVAFALYGTLSGKQLGAGIVTLSSPEKSAETTRAAESLLSSLTFGSFAPSKTAAAALVGTWEGGKSEGSRTSGIGGVSVASSTRYAFESNGRFSSRSQSIVSASGEFGDFGSGLSKDSTTEDDGRYFVVGKKLILSSTKNGTMVLDYTLQGNLLKAAGVTLRRR
jgi:hypothetical protein